MKAALSGFALRTPLGNDTDTFVRRLLAGERAAQTVDGGRVVAPRLPGEPAAGHGRFLGRLERLAIDTAHEALALALARAPALAPAGPAVAPERLGLFWATGGLRVRWPETRPALVDQRADGRASWANGLRLLHPFWLLQHLSNNGHALLAAELPARGEGGVFGGANAGAAAVAAAARALAVGAVDVALVVGCDSLLAPEADADAGWGWSRQPLDRLSAPYDIDAGGAVPGEAAAALVLRRPEDEAGRPRACVAATTGADGASGPAGTDALTAALGRVWPLPTAPDSAPRPTTRDRALLLDGAGLGVRARDDDERTALAKLCGGAGAPLGSIAAATGQLGAAMSLVQIVALASLLERRTAAPIAGLRAPAPGPLGPLARAQSLDPSVSAAVGVAIGPPGLVGVVAVEAA